MIELHRTTHDLERRAAVDGVDLQQHVIGQRLRVPPQIEQAVRGRPLAFHGLQTLAPIGKGPGRERRRDQLPRRGGIGREGFGVGKARIPGQVRQAEMLEGVAVRRWRPFA